MDASTLMVELEIPGDTAARVDRFRDQTGVEPTYAHVLLTLILMGLQLSEMGA